MCKLLAKPFANIAQLDAGGITLPVLYLLLAATAIWFLLEHTATGRRLYATGFNADAARLQGVRTDRLRFLTLVTSALLAGFAGVVFASSVGSGSPSAGTPYLLSAYAAAFVGATQLRAGRFNAWGTVIAVLLLGTGITGLGLATSAQWAASLFTGSVLIVALVLTGGRITLPAVLRRRKAPAPVQAPRTDGVSAPGQGVLTMKAVQYRKVGSAPEVVEVPVPEPGPGQVLLKVTAAGLCHSDLAVMSWPRGAVPVSRCR